MAGDEQPSTVVVVEEKKRDEVAEEHEIIKEQVVEEKHEEAKEKAAVEKQEHETIVVEKEHEQAVAEEKVVEAKERKEEAHVEKKMAEQEVAAATTHEEKEAAKEEVRVKAEEEHAAAKAEEKHEKQVEKAAEEKHVEAKKAEEAEIREDYHAGKQEEAHEKIVEVSVAPPSAIAEKKAAVVVEAPPVPLTAVAPTEAPEPSVTRTFTTPSGQPLTVIETSPSPVPPAPSPLPVVEEQKHIIIAEPLPKPPPTPPKETPTAIIVETKRPEEPIREVEVVPVATEPQPAPAVAYVAILPPATAPVPVEATVTLPPISPPPTVVSSSEPVAVATPASILQTGTPIPAPVVVRQIPAAVQPMPVVKKDEALSKTIITAPLEKTVPARLPPILKPSRLDSAKDWDLQELDSQSPPVGVTVEHIVNRESKITLQRKLSHCGWADWTVLDDDGVRIFDIEGFLFSRSARSRLRDRTSNTILDLRSGGSCFSHRHWYFDMVDSSHRTIMRSYVPRGTTSRISQRVADTIPGVLYTEHHSSRPAKPLKIDIRNARTGVPLTLFLRPNRSKTMAILDDRELGSTPVGEIVLDDECDGAVVARIAQIDKIKQRMTEPVSVKISADWPKYSIRVAKGFDMALALGVWMAGCNA